MVQAAQIHYRPIHICPSCFHIWFVCVINALSLSHFLFYLCLLGFSYCLTWHLFLSSAYQAHLIASCFASLFFFTFCYFQCVCPLPILPSPTYFLCAHFLYLSCWYFESAACFFFFFPFCFLSVLFMCIAIVLRCPGQSGFLFLSLTGDIVWKQKCEFQMSLEESSNFLLFHL